MHIGTSGHCSLGCLRRGWILVPYLVFRLTEECFIIGTCLLSTFGEVMFKAIKGHVLNIVNNFVESALEL
uniref:Putative ovule protein n=1 Tax=Solanum chacoense TaxID=4108 RepID=A0A0V0HQZ1_SOLCH